MIKYLKAKEYAKLDKLINLWNKDYRMSFPISKRNFQRCIIEDPNTDLEASYIALYDSIPVGFIFVKTWLRDTGIYKDPNNAFISLMYVRPLLRRTGIGEDLLNLAINEIKKHPIINKLSLGNDYYALFRGLPNEFSGSTLFFLNHGFKHTLGYVDMIKDIKDEQTNDNLRIATEDDKETIMKFCVDNECGAEALVVKDYYEVGGSGRRLVLYYDDDRLVGLASINEDVHMPLRINLLFKDSNVGNVRIICLEDEKYREELLNASMAYLSKRNVKRVIIPSVEDPKFYLDRDYLAFKYYFRMEKDI